MFCMYMVPLTPFFPSLNFTHHGFTFRRDFKEHNTFKLQGCAVPNSTVSSTAKEKFPLEPIFSQVNSVHIITTFFKVSLNIFPSLMSWSPKLPLYTRYSLHHFVYGCFFHVWY